MSPAAALYVDDLPEPPGTLHLAFGLAADGHARLTGARSRRGPRRARRGRGLHRRRHPRREQCRPGRPRRPALRRGRDPLSRPAAVRRRRDQHPRRARRRAAGEGRDRAAPRPRHHRRGARRPAPSSKTPQIMARGDAEAALAAAPHRLPGTLEMGGQEHFYLEGQAALATPGEDGPAPCRQLDPASERGPASDRRAARPASNADVTVEVRRMGGAFGGKETQAAAYRRRLRAGRGEDRPPGQDPRRPRRRHGHDRQAPRFHRRLRCRLRRRGPDRGHPHRRSPRAAAPPPTCQPAINDRAMFHADNCYFLPAVEIVSHRLQDPHRLQHRLPRLRRAAGDDGDRAGDGRDRRASRARSARRPPGQSLRPRPRRDALSHDGRGQCRARDHRRAGAERRLCRAARGGRRVQRRATASSRRASR